MTFALVSDLNSKVYFIGVFFFKLIQESLLSLDYISTPMLDPLSINVPGIIDGLRAM